MGLTKESEIFIESLNLNIGAKVLTLGRQQGGKFLEPCDALDISNYEGANKIWDLNNPIDESQHNQYDMVVDGGTLEHVFNTLGALENCYNLVKPNGFFVSHQLMNFCGHGFYQFCPEFFFKWAKWKDMIHPRCWVYSPTGSGLKIVFQEEFRREEFESFSHLYLLFSAQKVYEDPIHRPWPQQAGPSVAGRFAHWFWNTKLWSRIPVCKEMKERKKKKN